jgi:trimeric autotransporter adhesin
LQFDKMDSTEYGYNKDALDMGGMGALESLSLISSDNIYLSIYGVPYPQAAPENIALLVDAPASGSYQLKKIELNYMPALYQVWLKDAFMKDSINLSTDEIYNFKIDKSNPATFGTKRFSIVINQNPALIYHLLDFSAYKMPDSTQVNLTWKTANELTNYRFAIQRSIDSGKTFKIIDTLVSSNLGTYSLLDKNPVLGLNLYRLKQVDSNNIVTYSKLLPIEFNRLGYSIAKKDINIYPNPAVGMINLAIKNTNGNTTSTYTIRITNTSGMLIKKAVSTGLDWHYSIINLLPGTYFIVVVNNKDASLVGESRFVKM